MLELATKLVESLLEKLYEHIATSGLEQFIHYIAEQVIAHPTSALAVAVYIGAAIWVASIAYLWMRVFRLRRSRR